MCNVVFDVMRDGVFVIFVYDVVCDGVCCGGVVGKAHVNFPYFLAWRSKQRPIIRWDPVS